MNIHCFGVILDPMAQDCLWYSEEQHRGLTAQLICSSSRKHSSLRKESPAEVMLHAFVWDETASGTARRKTDIRQLSSAMLLLAVPEAVLSHKKTRSRDQLCSSFSVLLLAVPEAVSSHTKTRRISYTRS